MIIAGSVNQYVKNMFDQRKAQKNVRERNAALLSKKPPSVLRDELKFTTSKINFGESEAAQKVPEIDAAALLKPDRSKRRVASIEMKMKAGKKLSPAEMKYLKDNAPELYDKAIKIQAEREEYAKKLKECRTKAEVAQVKQMAMTEITASMPSGNNPKDNPAREECCMRLNAVRDEHNLFTSSKRYDDLPKDEEEAKKRRGAA